VTVEAWKTAGSYIDSSSSTIAESVDLVWGTRIVQNRTVVCRRLAGQSVDKKACRVQFRRLSNATWIFATRCAKVGSSFIMAATRSKLWITVE